MGRLEVSLRVSKVKDTAVPVPLGAAMWFMQRGQHLFPRRCHSEEGTCCLGGLVRWFYSHRPWEGPGGPRGVWSPV